MKRDLGQRQDPYIGWGLGLGVVLFLMYVYPGFMTPLTAHFDGSCQTLPLQASAEDLRIDPANGLVYLTYYDSVDARRSGRTPASSGTGTIMLVDLNAAEPHVRAALVSEPADFKPSGLSLYTKADGTKRLFVTSRDQLGKHSVEIFDQSATGAFAHVQTIRDAKLWSPTAIVAVGPSQFYVVNQLGFKRSFGGDWEIQTRDRLRGNQGSVVYYDGEQMKIVATDLGLPVGIAISADGHTVYVAQASRNIIQKFDRDPSNGALTPKDWIRIPGSPRNLTLDADGTLWVSSQPHGFPFSGWFDGTEDREPTQVFKVTPTADPDKQVQEIYLNDDGKELSDGSVAAPRGGGQFVLGSRTDHKLLMCTESDAAAKAADPAAKTTTS
jgi:hypothetical protein